MRCDLHVHTVYSGMCTVPLLRRVCRESYTDPVELYEALKRRGMDLVTVTDHDSLDAAEMLGRHPDFFASVEVTCTLPSGNEAHVGVYDITERQHASIQARRADIESLIAYLRAENLFFAINHAFSALTGARNADDWNVFEHKFQAAETRNGAMPARSNEIASAWAATRGMAPLGGSDAHTLQSAGLTFTTVPGARDKTEYLAGLRRGFGVVGGEQGSWCKLTRDVWSIGYAMATSDARLQTFAVLAPLVPAVTAGSFIRDRLFASKWGANRAAIPCPVVATDPARCAPVIWDTP